MRKYEKTQDSVWTWNEKFFSKEKGKKLWTWKGKIYKVKKKKNVQRFYALTFWDDPLQTVEKEAEDKIYTETMEEEIQVCTFKTTNNMCRRSMKYP